MCQRKTTFAMTIAYAETQGAVNCETSGSGTGTNDWRATKAVRRCRFAVPLVCGLLMPRLKTVPRRPPPELTFQTHIALLNRKHKSGVKRNPFDSLRSLKVELHAQDN